MHTLEMFLNGEICNCYINLSPIPRLIPDSGSIFQFRVLSLPPHIECRPHVAQTSMTSTQVKYPNVTISSPDISYLACAAPVLYLVIYIVTIRSASIVFYKSTESTTLQTYLAELRRLHAVAFKRRHRFTIHIYKKKILLLYFYK